MIAGNLYGMDPGLKTSLLSKRSSVLSPQPVKTATMAWVKPDLMEEVYNQEFGVFDDGRFHFATEYAPRSLYGDDVEILHQAYQERAACVIDRGRFVQGFEFWLEEQKKLFFDRRKSLRGDTEKDNEDDLSAKLKRVQVQLIHGIARNDRELAELKKERRQLKREREACEVELQKLQKKELQLEDNCGAVVSVIRSAQRSIKMLSTTFLDIDDPKIVCRRNQKIGRHQSVIDKHEDVAIQLAELDEAKINVDLELQEIEKQLDELESDREFFISKREAFHKKKEQVAWSLQQAIISERVFAEDRAEKQRLALLAEKRRRDQLEELQRKKAAEEEARRQEELRYFNAAQVKISSVWKKHKARKELAQFLKEQKRKELEEELARKREEAERKKQEEHKAELVRLRRQKKKLDKKALEAAQKRADEERKSQQEVEVVKNYYATFMETWGKECRAYKILLAKKERELGQFYKNKVRAKRMSSAAATKALRQEFLMWQENYRSKNPWVALTQKAAEDRASVAARTAARQRAMETGKKVASVVDKSGLVMSVRPTTAEDLCTEEALQKLVQSSLLHVSKWSLEEDNIDKSLSDMANVVEAFRPKYIEMFPVALEAIPMVGVMRSMLQTKLMSLQGTEITADDAEIVFVDPEGIVSHKKSLQKSSQAMRALFLKAQKAYTTDSSEENKRNVDIAKAQYREVLIQLQTIDAQILDAKKQKYQHQMRCLLDFLGGPIEAPKLTVDAAGGPSLKGGGLPLKK